jgi:hypothetical protein
LVPAFLSFRARFCAALAPCEGGQSTSDGSSDLQDLAFRLPETRERRETGGGGGHTLPPPILMYESFLPWFLVSLVFLLALANAMRRDTTGRSLATVFFSFLPAAKSGAPEEVVWRSPLCDGAPEGRPGLCAAKCDGHGPG